MKLYLISQDENNGYDTYDSGVVSAKSEDDARTIHPSSFVTHVTNGVWMGSYNCPEKPDHHGKEYPISDYDWVSYLDIGKIEVKYLGETNEPRGMILGSFNAG